MGQQPLAREGSFSRLKNELTGLRGSWIYRYVKHAWARAVGRAFWYDHLTAAIDYSLSVHAGRGRPLNYYEFGTGSGNTVQRAVSALQRYPGSRIYLFDSFVGLPAPQNARDQNTTWKRGDFAFSEAYIREVVERAGWDPSHLMVVKGFFEQSLTGDLQRQLAPTPPAFVTIDVDYYSSTRAVLEFLGPILISGCAFYFDDLWSFDGHPEYGQLKAISEFNEASSRGRLVPNPILGNRIFTYFSYDYEFAPSIPGHG